MSEKKQKDENLNNRKTSKAKNNDDDIFDLDNLRLSQSFQELVGVKKAVTTIPVRRPHRQEFIRVRSGEEWRLETAVIELKEEREIYLIDPALRSEFFNEITPKILFTTINRQKDLALWPVRLPGEDGRLDQWNQSALLAAEIAETRWIRLASNMSLRAYDVFTAEKDLPDPEWPEISFQEIIKIAFQDKIIRSPDHPVIQQLRGCL